MSSKDFQLWLNQSVWVNGVERETRRKYIPFCAKELTNFMRSRGYVMDTRWADGTAVLARWMYNIQHDELYWGDYNSAVKYPEASHRDWPEDQREFQYIMDHDTISSFMDTWKLYEDFDQDTRIGQRMLHELQFILYPYIDMDNSYNGQVVAEALDDNDSDTDSWKSGRRNKKMDVYLIDANEGFHR